MAEHPATRRLRVLAFDPSLATRLETATINEITVEIPWEDDLCPGPVGEYIEVVDYDPASGVFYKPVDLNDPYLLAQDGLPPSESNPQFHQQMVYAVAMSTIRQFERPLGRVALWSDRLIRNEDGTLQDQCVRRLRIYPHALRDRNAYYSPAKKALLFGYFPVTKMGADEERPALVSPAAIDSRGARQQGPGPGPPDRHRRSHPAGHCLRGLMAGVSQSGKGRRSLLRRRHSGQVAGRDGAAAPTETRTARRSQTSRR